MRVWNQPGPGLIFWLLLLVPIFAGGHWLVRRFREWTASPEADGSTAAPLKSGLRFAQVVIGTLALLILIGFVRTEPIRESQSERVFRFIHAGMEAQEAGKEVAAQEYYALVLGIDPANKFALYNLGLLQENAGYASWTRILYERALAADPAFAPAAARLAGLGQALGPTAGQPPAASEDPCPTPADCFQSGKRLWDAGDKPGALAVWQRGAEKFPKETYFIRNVALCRYDLGDYEGAVRDYRKALSDTPGDIGLRTDLAWALLRAGRLDEARQTCNEVLAADPGNAGARAILARIAK